MKPTLAVLLFFGLFTSGWCARILAVLPFPARSHHMFATAIIEALAEKGHSIVEYSPFPPKSVIPNHTHHTIRSTFERGVDKWTFEDIKDHAKKFDDCIFGARIQIVWEISDDICEETFKEENIVKLLKSNEKIDLVLVGSSLGQASLLAFGHIFSAPTIVMDTLFPHSLINWDAGNSLSIASIPDLHAATMASEKMTLLERALNLISTLRTLYLYQNVHLPKHDSFVRKTTESLGLKSVPPLSQLVTNVSLFLTNSHPAAINYPRPYTPNMVAVGGITINAERQQLTEELKNYMDTAAEGVIYFSMGTNIPAHTMTKENFQIFINAFKRLPQKVLWKIDMANVKIKVDLPSNVKTVQWAPQLGVLGHPRCLVFITHGGLFSHQEAMYAGVPTVGVPFFADQPYNVRHSEARGTGVRLPLDRLDDHTLYEAVTTVLNDPKYRENARKMSLIYRDWPVSPKDLAVYWVEYVLRHRGAPHLRPASATMAWYKLFLLDVIAFILAAVLIVAFVVYKTIKRLGVMLVLKGKANGKFKKLN